MNRQFQDDQRPRNSRNDEQFPSNSRTHDNSGHDRRNSDQPKKEEPNFGLSGKLTEYTNTYKVGSTNYQKFRTLKTQKFRSLKFRTNAGKLLTLNRKVGWRKIANILM